jgi:uncharacterized membrane protein
LVLPFPADAAPKQSSGITYNATLLNLPAGSSANGINDAGQIVGETGTSGNQYGFIYELTQAPSVTLIRDGTDSTQAYGINNAGQVVGSGYNGNNSYGFIYTGGNFTNFSAPGAILGGTLAHGVNSTGQIVGYAGGAVVGGVAGPYQGFVYSGGAYQFLNVPGATDTVAEGINSTGEIVGYWQTSTRASGFIYKNGVYTVIDVPGSTSTQLLAIRFRSDRWGLHRYEQQHRSLLHIRKRKLRRDHRSSGRATVSGTASGGVNGINKAGQIVGWGTTSSCASCAFVADPVVKLKK